MKRRLQAAAQSRQSAGCHADQVRRGLRAFPRGLPRAVGTLPSPPAGFPADLSRRVFGFAGVSDSLAGPGFLSHRWTPVSSSCTCARAPERELKRLRDFPIWWSSRFASRSRRRRSIASSTTSVCLIAASIFLTVTPHPSGPADADILVSLKKDHRPTAQYIHDLRLRLPQEFPGVTFSFLPADIVSQILNFGLPAPIDVQVVGYDLQANRAFADKLLERSPAGSWDCRSSHPATL